MRDGGVNEKNKQDGYKPVVSTRKKKLEIDDIQPRDDSKHQWPVS